MGSENVRQVLEAYAETHDPKYFAEEATFAVLPLGQTYTGREAIGGMLGFFYHGPFADARADIRQVLVDTQHNAGTVEFAFKGRHAGEVMGMPASGRDVNVPMLAVYEFVGNQIQRARMFFDGADFMRQLGRGE